MHAGENINFILSNISFNLCKTTMQQAEVALIARGFNKDNNFEVNKVSTSCFTSVKQELNGTFKRVFLYSDDGNTVSRYDVYYCAKSDIRDQMLEKVEFEMLVGWGTNYCGEYNMKYVDFDSEVMVVSSENLEINLFDIPAIRISFYTKAEFNNMLEEWKKDLREKNVAVTTLASFAGGDDGISQFLKENISYPPMELENGIQGVVIVIAQIGEDGNVLNTAIKRGVSASIDREACRVISKMSGWNPAIASDGKPIRSNVEIPVVFKCVPEPHISMLITPADLNIIKYGEYCSSAFDEGCVVLNVVINKNGNVSNMKIDKSLTTISNPLIIKSIHDMVSKTMFERQKSNVKRQITVTLQYI